MFASFCLFHNTLNAAIVQAVYSMYFKLQLQVSNLQNAPIYSLELNWRKHEELEKSNDMMTTWCVQANGIYPH